MEECDQEDWSVSDTFGIITTCWAAYHLEVGALVSLKAVKKVSSGGKKFWKSRFLGYFSNAKTEECKQEDWSVFDTFGIVTPSSALYHLEMGAPFSLNLATKASFECQKPPKIYIFRPFFRVKRRSATKKTFDKFGSLMSGLDTYSGRQCTRLAESNHQNFL